MYFMIGIWGDRTKIHLPGFKREVETRLYASIKFFLFTLFGSAFMLLGFLALYFVRPATFNGGSRTGGRGLSEPFLLGVCALFLAEGADGCCHSPDAQHTMLTVCSVPGRHPVEAGSYGFIRTPADPA
jgi:NADH:ubiquinone oxidoreductase subunit 5 (subunit L)/multisubunit Na+/H+ antiporter MnhA subunit